MEGKTTRDILSIFETEFKDFSESFIALVTHLNRNMKYRLQLQFKRARKALSTYIIFLSKCRQTMYNKKSFSAKRFLKSKV